MLIIANNRAQINDESLNFTVTYMKFQVDARKWNIVRGKDNYCDSTRRIKAFVLFSLYRDDSLLKTVVKTCPIPNQ